MEEGAYTQSAGGSPAPLGSYSTELNNLTVDNAWFNTNDLASSMQNSSSVSGGP
jgi:hypothetical protein